MPGLAPTLVQVPPLKIHPVCSARTQSKGGAVGVGPGVGEVSPTEGAAVAVGPGGAGLVHGPGRATVPTQALGFPQLSAKLAFVQVAAAVAPSHVGTQGLA